MVAPDPAAMHPDCARVRAPAPMASHPDPMAAPDPLARNPKPNIRGTRRGGHDLDLRRGRRLVRNNDIRRGRGGHGGRSRWRRRRRRRRSTTGQQRSAGSHGQGPFSSIYFFHINFSFQTLSGAISYGQSDFFLLFDLFVLEENGEQKPHPAAGGGQKAQNCQARIAENRKARLDSHQ